VLEERIPGSYDKDASGNNFLYRLMGANGIHVVEGGSNVPAKMEEVAGELKAQGRKPYIIPGGGSNEIGALGYAACAQELMHQLSRMCLKIDHIVLTTGSTGTHSGMLTGMCAINGKIPITGISISRSSEKQMQLVMNLCERTFAKLGLSNSLAQDDIIVKDQYVGDGYSLPTAGMAEAVRHLACTEQIILDPVYTGKTMDGLIGLVKQGYFQDCENILFLHTGGAPSLYHYRADVLS
jgi:D-cysteine desulfhydrase